MFRTIFAFVCEGDALEPPEAGTPEDGFTLIELMVVLLIIAILLAVAIPTFLGVSGSARDRSAQSNLTNAMTDAIAYYQNGQTYDATTGAGGTAASQTGTASGSTAYAMQQSEPAFTWVAGGTACTVANTKCVSALPVDAASTDDGQGVIIAVMSATGNCWYSLDLEINPVAQPNATTTADNYNGTQNTLLGLDGTASTSSTTGLYSGGTYYAEENVNTAGGSCSATRAQAFANWYSTYAKAGAHSE